MKRAGLARKLSLVLGSFVIAGMILIVYLHVPPTPVFAGGFLAIFVTVLFHLFSK